MAIAVPALRIQNLRKRYANEVLALDGISFEVPQGDFYALLGPNGAGKSTAIGIISSLVNKTSGLVEIFGHSIDREFSAAKRQLGLVPQEFNFNGFEPAVEIVTNQAGYYGIPYRQARESAENALQKLGLWEKRHDTPRELSGGMKRRLMIARALVHEPKLLILDEPTAGVDIEIRRSMWRFLEEINESGTTIILTTHYLEEAENLCRNIGIINQGKMLANSSMRDLLDQLENETFILYLKDALEQAPVIEGHVVRMVDPRTLEVSASKSTTIGQLISLLEKQNIQVLSMKNKTSRLEELFLNLVKPKNGAPK